MIVPVPRIVAWAVLLLSIAVALAVVTAQAFTDWTKNNAEDLLDALDRESLGISATVVDDRSESWRDDSRWTVHLRIDKRALRPIFVKIPSRMMFVATGKTACEYTIAAEQTIQLVMSSSYRLKTLTSPKGCGVRVAHSDERALAVRRTRPR